MIGLETWNTLFAWPELAIVRLPGNLFSIQFYFQLNVDWDKDETQAEVCKI